MKIKCIKRYYITPQQKKDIYIELCKIGGSVKWLSEQLCLDTRYTFRILKGEMPLLQEYLIKLYELNIIKDLKKFTSNAVITKKYYFEEKDKMLLQENLQDRKLTQKWLANELGITRYHLGSLLNGSYSISQDKLKIIKDLKLLK